MTEQEAIKVLERTKMLSGLPDQGCTWKANAETIALDMAISALEEIQQYRAIGTVKEFQKLKANSFSGIELAGIAIGMMRLEKYEAIGTVEDCQESREKQRAVKPVTYQGTNRADCPACGATVRGIDKPFGDWCSKCGQRLDWSEDEVPDGR